VIELFNRILVRFRNEEEVEYLTRYTKLIHEKYNNIEIVGLFIKSAKGIEEYKILKGYDCTPSDWEQIEKIIDLKKKEEEKTEERIKNKFSDLMGNSEFYVLSGSPAEILLEELKLFDILVMSKPKILDHEFKTLFKNHYKPIIFVPKLGNYSFEKILLANDHQFESYKALFNFMGIFEGVKNITSISVNLKEDEKKDLNIYFNRSGRNIECIYEVGNIANVLLENSKIYDLLIMGDLKHSFTFERIAGKPGIKLIEEINKPLFMG
jgi:hypothetical protein